MKRDIQIKVTGTQSTQGAGEEPEVIELTTTGKLFEKDGSTYIKYDEFVEDSDQVTKNLLKFDNQALQVTKTGAVGTVMSFDKYKDCSAHYITPYGPININICTENYAVERTEDGVSIDVRYSLDYSFGCVIDCSLSVAASYINP